MKASLFKVGSALALALLLGACGGGGGGGIATGGTGGTGISSGTIEAIGSVRVNGVTFSCDGAEITDDDGTVDQGQGDNCVSANQAGELDPGMVVTIDGNPNSTPPLATKVRIRPRLRGPVQSIDVAAGSFVVLGQTVLVDGDTRFKLNGNSNATITNLTTTMTVQVHGFVDGEGRILATYVKTKSPNPSTPGEFEVKGVIDITGDVITLGNLTISLNGFTTPALSDGLCVELKGRVNATGDSLTLTRAPKLDDDCDGLANNLAKAEIEGIVSGFTAADQEFKVGEQRVKLGSPLEVRGGTLAEDLVDGAKVEVEGAVADGLLTARQISFKRNGVRMQAQIDSVNEATKTATALGITIKWDDATRREDDLQVGSMFEIRGRKSGAAQVTASRIREKDDDDTELQGPVDATPASGATSFTILGVQIDAASASFEGLTGVSDIEANDVIKAKGTEINNTTIDADEVEAEDD